ncbi:ADP-ribose glycohydrolase OARD1-like [Halichondria panicea]|uniref:ADP-ribose glycohydrolase OARD1-like n=1 Tax=Halichondria panicea TaxID=6063 RepID=UPI00312B9BB8
MASSRKSRVQSGPLSATPAKRSTRRSSSQSSTSEHSSLSGGEPPLPTSTGDSPPTTDPTLTMVQGDLFSCPNSSSLAHCISADISMGKGVAKVFKTQFGGVAELKAQGVQTGGVAVLKKHGRFIYYLVTKQRHFHKPTYETLNFSLQAMKKHCLANKVSELCMPMIGCGLDLLDWGKVKPLIVQVFAGIRINITIYYL